jgi:DNA-binding NarL/FixJ family response regulator
VLVADDSPVFLAAAVDVVEATPGFGVVATCYSGREAVELAGTLRPDLALVDESMTGEDPARAAREIEAASPATLVILVSVDPKPFDGTTPLLHKAHLSPATLADLWRQRHAKGEGRAPTGQT